MRLRLGPESPVARIGRWRHRNRTAANAWCGRTGQRRRLRRNRTPQQQGRCSFYTSPLSARSILLLYLLARSIGESSLLLQRLLFLNRESESAGEERGEISGLNIHHTHADKGPGDVHAEHLSATATATEAEQPRSPARQLGHRKPTPHSHARLESTSSEATKCQDWKTLTLNCTKRRSVSELEIPEPAATNDSVIDGRSDCARRRRPRHLQTRAI